MRMATCSCSCSTLQGFACSSGSACKTGNPEPSDAMSPAWDFSRDWALGSLRVTLGLPQRVPMMWSDLSKTLLGLVEKARGMRAQYA
jgi:cysteine sulfinate desulfinase/cysteine desulfurase-like protein